MINFINSWAQGIIIAIIIATLIEIILPNGNNKKYVKTIIGIYILFITIYPLISKISNKKIDVQSIIDDTTEKINKYGTNNNIVIETNSYIEETYKEKIQEDLNKKLKEKGYNVNSLNLDIDNDDNDYGQINSMIIQVTKIENNKEDNQTKSNTNNTVNKIEKIEINVTDNNINKNIDVEKKSISNKEINTLKDYINTIYMIDKEKIHINE